MKFNYCGGTLSGGSSWSTIKSSYGFILLLLVVYGFLSITLETDLFVLDRAKCVSHIFNGRQEGHSDDDP
jgi:hypothetical protein